MSELEVTLTTEGNLDVQIVESSAIEVILDEIDTGAQGPQGIYTEEIFTNASSAGSAPTGGAIVVGGAVTPPTGWYRAGSLPATPDGERPYVSRASINPATQTGTITPTWGTPIPAGVPGPKGDKGDKGERVWIQFSSNNSTWSGTTTSTTKWIRFAIAGALPGSSDAAWSSGIEFVADDPLQLWIQYSSDGSVWHDAQASGRTHIRFAKAATKPGNSNSAWSAGVDLRGTDGIDGTSITGPQGVRGFYYVEIYRAAATKPTGATSINVNVDAGTVVGVSTGWAAAVPVLTSGQRLWAQRVQIKPGTGSGRDQGAAASIASSRFSEVFPYTGSATAQPVAANPGGDPTTELTTITINGEDYALGGGTEVAANPGGTPTTKLTTITIDGEDFVIDSGSAVDINDLIVSADVSVNSRTWANPIATTDLEANQTSVVQGDRLISWGSNANLGQAFSLKAGTYLISCNLYVATGSDRAIPVTRIMDGANELCRSNQSYDRFGLGASTYQLFVHNMLLHLASDEDGLRIFTGSGPDENDTSQSATTRPGSGFSLGGGVAARQSFYRFTRFNRGITINMGGAGGGSDISLLEEGTALPTAMEELNVIGKRVTASNDPDTPANKRMNFTLTDQDIGSLDVRVKKNHDRLEDAGTYIPTFGNYQNAGDDEYFQHFGLQLEGSDGDFNSFGYSTAYPTGDDTGTQILRISVPHGTRLDTVDVTRTTSGGGVSFFSGASNWGKVEQSNGHAGVEYYEWQGSTTNTLRVGIAANDTWRIRTRSVVEKFQLDPEKLAQIGARDGQVMKWDESEGEWVPGDIANATAITDILHRIRDLFEIAPGQDWEAAVAGDADLFAVINSSGNNPPTGITLTDANFTGAGPDITTGDTAHVFYAIYIRIPIAADRNKLRVYMVASSIRGGAAWHKVEGPSPDTYQYFFVGQAGNYVGARVFVQKIPDGLAKTQFAGELIDEAASGADSARELALENKSRLDAIEELEEVVGDFVNVTLEQNVRGWQFGSSTDTADATELDNFEFGDLTFAGVDTNRIFGVSTPQGVSINRVQLDWDGTIYPSAATSTHWEEYRPGEGAKWDRAYYFVAADADDTPTVFVTGGGKELDMQIAPVTHTFAIELTAVTLTWWQDGNSSGNAPNDAGEETAYISGGLTPIEFPRMTGTRYLHFSVPEDQAIDLIAVNGNNEFSMFTEDAATAGVRKFHSKKLSNSAKIDTLVRVIEHTA